VHNARAGLRGWRVPPLSGRRDQRLDKLVSEANDLIGPHVAPDHSVGQARLKRLIDDAPAPGEIGLAKCHEFLKRQILRDATPLRMQVTRQTASYMSSLMGQRALVVEVPEARHHVMLDQPLAFVAALRMLLDSWMRNESVEESGYTGR
jgi:hypothetical protein